MEKFYHLSFVRALVVIAAIFAFILGGCLSSAVVHYEPGIYEGSGQGYGGTIRVRVFLSESGIEDIEIVEHQEDNFAVFALEELCELALEMNSADIDAISGATVSSKGFLEALETALNDGSAAHHE